MKDKFYFVKLAIHIIILLVLNYFGLELIYFVLNKDSSSGFSSFTLLINLIVIIVYVLLNLSKPTFYLVILNLSIWFFCMIFYDIKPLAFFILLSTFGLFLLWKNKPQLVENEVSIWGVLIVIVWIFIVEQLI